MSAQRLSDRTIRRLARITGLDIIRAWAHGGYYYDFVTSSHQHGSYDKKTGEWELIDNPWVHYTSCKEMFPNEDSRD